MRTDVVSALRSSFDETLTALDLRARTVHAVRRRVGSQPCVVIAIGKSAAPMLAGALDALGPHALRWVAARPRRATPVSPDPRGVEWITGHPLPDDASIDAGSAIVADLASMPDACDVLVLVSGGASAAACMPRVPLAAYRDALSAWIAAGFPIDVINQGRARLDSLKSGGLAEAAGEHRVVTLLAVDVLGPLDESVRSVGSGPTLAHSPDSATMDRLRNALPPSVRGMFDAAGPLRRRERTHDVWEAIASPRLARDTFAGRLASHGVQVKTLDDVADDIDAAAARYARLIADVSAGTALVASGEPTVRLPDVAGHGGRAGRLALFVARAIETHDVAFMAAATDGVDGESGHAGAIVTRETAARARDLGLDLDEALARFDDGPANAALGTAIDIAPTGINLLDLHVLIRM